MTAQEDSVPGHDAARPAEAALDVCLNLVYPGLAQLTHGRRGAAVLFAAEAAVLLALFVAFPAWRILTVIGLTVLTALSILDAVGARHTD